MVGEVPRLVKPAGNWAQARHIESGDRHAISGGRHGAGGAQPQLPSRYDFAGLRREPLGFDIIGDVHGHAVELEALLLRLGYRLDGGTYRHPDRVAVFVADFLDRGPQVRETLCLVRAMLEAKSALAVLGNHEWNAFGFHTQNPREPDRWLRPRNRKNRRQHAATLAQVPADELAEHLTLLRTLPFHLDLGCCRVVHACWEASSLCGEPGTG